MWKSHFFNSRADLAEGLETGKREDTGTDLMLLYHINVFMYSFLYVMRI